MWMQFDAVVSMDASRVPASAAWQHAYSNWTAVLALHAAVHGAAVFAASTCAASQPGRQLQGTKRLCHCLDTMYLLWTAGDQRLPKGASSPVSSLCGWRPHCRGFLDHPVAPQPSQPCSRVGCFDASWPPRPPLLLSAEAGSSAGMHFGGISQTPKWSTLAGSLQIGATAPRHHQTAPAQGSALHLDTRSLSAHSWCKRSIW